MKKQLFLLALAVTGLITNGLAQDPHLHVNPQWSECSFQLDPSLTQSEFHQFTQEAGFILYFRPLIDAKPMGVGHVELSILQWRSKIDEHDGAWNNTFVHPDSTHWLIGGPVLPFPGLTLRAGITPKLDAGAYWTMRPGANYGVFGLQAQYNLIDEQTKGWSSSCRVSSMHLYGPSDVRVNSFGLDVLASKRFGFFHDHASLSPYAGTSLCFSRSSENSEAVNLNAENRIGAQGNVGVVGQFYFLRLAAEYNLAAVPSISYKLGFAYTFGKKS